MTGIFVRIERDGRWVNLEIEKLTDIERIRFFRDNDKEHVLRWLNRICEIISDLQPANTVKIIE